MNFYTQYGHGYTIFALVAFDPAQRVATGVKLLYFVSSNFKMVIFGIIFYQNPIHGTPLIRDLFYIYDQSLNKNITVKFRVLPFFFYFSRYFRFCFRFDFSEILAPTFLSSMPIFYLDFCIFYIFETI